MGNICDCLKGSTAEPAYEPIATVEVVQAPRPRPVERSGNNYQSILEKAKGDFISSKYRSRSEGVAINNSSEGAESVRSKFTKAELNAQVVCSPPSTGIITQSYATFESNDQTAPGQKGGANGKESRRAHTEGGNSAVSALHAAPYRDTALEGSADGLAQLVMKQTDRNIDKFSSNPNDFSAVVGFKPFEGSINSR